MSEYVITDGEKFIYRNVQGRYVPCSNGDMADVFSKGAAEGILRSSLPKALRGVFYIKKRDTPQWYVKQVSMDDLRSNTEKAAESGEIRKWVCHANDMCSFMKDARARRDELGKRLKELEDEKTDIEHYIEFQNLNAAQGYKASMELKECRIKRRAVKNELCVLDAILRQDGGGILMEEVQEKIRQMDSRVYRPRIRVDLFDL